MREYTFVLTLAAVSNYVTERVKVKAESLTEAFKLAVDAAKGKALRGISLLDIY